MRVAFSGTHRTGKTTLVTELAALLPGYAVIDEPYRVLEDEGYEHSDPPSLEDYEAQLRTSLAQVAAAPADALFDRCPLDVLAYIEALDGEPDEWIDDVRDAIARLDLIVFVPIEPEIPVGAHEDRRLRRRVDERLQRLVLDDPFGLDVTTLEVFGNLAARVHQVRRAMRL